MTVQWPIGFFSQGFMMARLTLRERQSSGGSRQRGMEAGDSVHRRTRCRRFSPLDRFFDDFARQPACWVGIGSFCRRPYIYGGGSIQTMDLNVRIETAETRRAAVNSLPQLGLVRAATSRLRPDSETFIMKRGLLAEVLLSICSSTPFRNETSA